MNSSNLHEYQKQAIDFIIENRQAGLMIDMGLGKTIITLTAIEEILYHRLEALRVLVIAPLRVAKTTWMQEAKKWEHTSHMTFSLALGSEKERMAALEKFADITLINRENVPWLVQKVGRDWPFEMVVIDELSSFRNGQAKRFKALRAVRPKIRRIVGLTGTPAPKGLHDLWAQIYLLDQGYRLGHTLTAYRDRWFYPGARSGNVVFEWLPREGADREIQNKLSDLCVSMRASDHLKMPEVVRIVRQVEMPEDARIFYQRLERDLIAELENGESIAALSQGALAGKLMQVANGAVYDENKRWTHVHDAKLDELEDLIEAAGSSPVLVFYAYRHDAERIEKKFPQAVRMGDDGNEVERWNRGEIPLLLCHPASAGHGLNLQHGGSIMIWFGMTWDLELYQQAVARLARQGQKETVRVYHIVAAGTRDTDCLPVLDGRAVTQNDLLEALKARSYKLS